MTEYEELTRVRKLYSQEAEQSVLGAILLNPECLDDVVEVISAEDFYFQQHQAMFQAMQAQASANLPIDVVTMAEDHSLDLDYLVEICQNTPSANNALVYAKVIRERKTERDLYSVGDQIKGLIMTDGMTTEERVSEAQRLFTGVSSEKQAKTQVSMDEALRDAIEAIDRGFQGEEDLNNIKTGLIQIDKRINGYRPGNFILLAARPGGGKTTLAMQIVRHCIRHHGKAMVFSLEMPSRELINRMLSASGSVNMDVIRNPKTATESDWPKISTATVNLRGLPLVIDDQGGLTIGELQSRARREHRKSPIKLIVVDYLQLMRSSSKKETRNLEIGEISQGLKNLAKELNCPVIALSQLSRDIEKRPDQTPRNSDLRDSGSLEQDADIIQFLSPVDEESTTIKLSTTKFRDGQTGVDYLESEFRYNRFANTDFVPQSAARVVKNGYI